MELPAHRVGRSECTALGDRTSYAVRGSGRRNPRLPEEWHDRTVSAAEESGARYRAWGIIGAHRHQGWTMPATIFLLTPEGHLSPLEESGYATEDELQRLLAENPDLLAGEQISPEDPVRWLLVSREAGIADGEAGGLHWALDHLFLDQRGVPTLAEVKRASNRKTSGSGPSSSTPAPAIRAPRSTSGWTRWGRRSSRERRRGASSATRSTPSSRPRCLQNPTTQASPSATSTQYERV